MAKVSVIVPIYGVEKYLKEALDSIVNQTLKDLEIILINDGSNDNCPQIIDEYAKKDNRIIAIHKENGGYGQTVNIGLKKAKGEYIAILEPDDYISLNMYENLYEIAKKYNSDIVKSSFYENLQTPQLKLIRKVNWKDYIPEYKSFTIKEYPYFLSYHPSIWSCIYKREFLNKYNIHFVEAQGAGWSDNPFQVQTMCLAKSINYTNKAYYFWRRLNFNESDDLKDYNIPFKRSDEIHRWLKENNINDENILINIFRREIAYANIVLGMKKLTDEKDCYKKIKVLFSRCPETFCQSKYVKTHEIKTYLSIKKNPKLVRFKIKFKNIRRNILSIHLNKREKRILLFGRYIYGGGLR